MILKENWVSTDKITVNDITNIINQLAVICNTLGIYVHNNIISMYGVENGKFWYTENLNRLEQKLYEINQQVKKGYSKREWYDLSVISYKDINRWSIFLNETYNLIFSSGSILTETGENIITEDGNIITKEE